MHPTDILLPDAPGALDAGEREHSLVLTRPEHKDSERVDCLGASRTCVVSTIFEES